MSTVGLVSNNLQYSIGLLLVREDLHIQLQNTLLFCDVETENTGS